MQQMEKAKDTGADIFIRWAARFDFDQIFEIDALSDAPIGAAGIMQLIRQQNSMMAVAEESPGVIVGVRGITFFDDEISLDYLAVHPDCRRRGIGTALLLNLETKVRGHRTRRGIYMSAPGCSLSLHLTLAACGYIAWWVDHVADSLFFEWFPTTSTEVE